MTTQYTVKGIISAERPCECCGNKNLEKNVVLEDKETGSLMYVGTTCAGYLVRGQKTAKNGKLIELEAKAQDYIAKWTGIHGTSPDVLNKIANGVRVHFCPCWVIDGQIKTESAFARTPNRQTARP